MTSQRRWIGRARPFAAAGVAVAAAAAFVMPAAVQASPTRAAASERLCAKDGATALAGSTASVEAVGAQLAFNIVPGPLPLSGNLVEEDLSFARSLVSSGPQASVQAAPFYPGDTAANLGSLLASDGVPLAVPNYPLQAFASFPASPKEPASSTFPAKEQSSASVASASAHASATGASAVATIAHLGAGPLSVAKIQSTNTVTPAKTCMTAEATTVAHGIDIAGLVHISSLDSEAGARTDGKNAVPSSAVTVGQVTVAGLAASIDAQGIHVLKQVPTVLGLTPRVVQSTLDQTFRADGLSVRLLEPTRSSHGGTAAANSGALVITISHAVDVPYLPGEPTVPVPGLGNVPLPSGLYKATATVTLGASTAQAVATLPPTTSPTTSPVGAPIPGASSGVGPIGSVLPPGGTSTAPGGPPVLAGPGSSGLSAFVHGAAVPLGWVLVGILLCLLFGYPMLYGAWAQLLKGRET
ncbi:MAG TPA: hypothetical protein VHB18_16125 [Mycobacteriales bacterium]|nr:hypothetical protein [Mycobacteriales bacterium]